MSRFESPESQAKASSPGRFPKQISGVWCKSPEDTVPGPPPPNRPGGFRGTSHPTSVGEVSLSRLSPEDTEKDTSKQCSVSFSESFSVSSKLRTFFS